MNIDKIEFTLIEDEAALADFYELNKAVSWMGFDTEFVGERRFVTLICLIQVATDHGYFLIDTLKIKNIQPVLDLIVNPKILKITHAGENDYRLLFKQYNILPKNIVDTQIAAAFVGFKYPVSFQKLIETQLKIYISKGYTVSDWIGRPIKPKQLKYALNDVLYLQELWQSLETRLQAENRLEWVIEELKDWETAAYYYTDPNKEALTNSMILGLNEQEQVFLIRLYKWRRSEAKRKNYSKEMILPGKLIGSIVKNVNSGKAALLNHRRIPRKTVETHWSAFNKLYQDKANEEELAVLKRIVRHDNDNPKYETLFELLMLLMKYRCHEQNIAHGLVIHRSEFKKMKTDMSFFDEKLEKGWRKNVFGKVLINWLKQRKELEIEMTEEECIIRMKE